MPTYSALILFTLVIAFLYSSVGHGGASGYLAVMSFFSFQANLMATNALILNLLVAGIAFFAFLRTSHFSWSFSWPFILTSMPASFVGGLFALPQKNYEWILLGVLLFATYKMFFLKSDPNSMSVRNYSIKTALLFGGALGFFSGMIGVGGGIFLSPLLILLGWADSKKVAATAALFIWVNSFAGLLGRLQSGAFESSTLMIALLSVALIGSLIGSRLGASFFSGHVVRKMLGFVLLVACLKLAYGLMI